MRAIFSRYRSRESLSKSLVPRTVTRLMEWEAFSSCGDWSCFGSFSPAWLLVASIFPPAASRQTTPRRCWSQRIAGDPVHK